MNKMTREEVDRLITESLSKDEAEFYNSLDEGNVFQMWGSVYKGKLGWLAVIMSIVHTVVVAICFYSGYKLFTVAEIADMLHYGSILFIALSFGAMIKLWHWLQMDKKSILREIKRLEFQVAVLMEKVGSK